ncbi:multidrug ABC transporter permease [Paenibacillus sp. J31TS4]|uniref:ABC transporter ATP-binding protein n=1 Tax=Paenibacillus sp. J31TS4 TaxID=2807195 RepID=UPI001B0EE260|nr:ABC transporter ATP-binding protein [Paenibacillus sp. J31TS4]GIP39104.1 multidrug ABC transporter permease [Paenibacillus sp. J31TS4]
MKLDARPYGLADVIRLTFRSSPAMAALVALQTLLGGVVPTLQIVATAKFLDTALAVVRGEAERGAIYAPLLIVVALLAYSWIAGELNKLGMVRLELAIREQFRTAVLEKRAKLAYRYIEDHEAWDVVSRVANKPEIQLKNAYSDLLSLTALGLRVFGVLGLLVAHVWWAALLILVVSVPLFALAVRSGRATYQANRDVSRLKRRYEYMRDLLKGRDAVEERTLFGFGGAMNAAWQREYETARVIEYNTEKAWFIKMKSGSVLTALLSIVITLVLLQPVLSGALTIGMFLSLVNAIFGMVQMMSWQLTRQVEQLAKHREFMRDTAQLAAMEEAEGACEEPAASPPVFKSLEFVNVRFRYPGSERPILDGLTLRIEAGAHYAFVGVNGAGKTTLTKLLTGLYTDYEGSILLNGRELSTYSQPELKAFFSVVYQDFARYSIRLSDNIAVGDVRSLGAGQLDERIRHVIGTVGLGPVVERLPLGADTPLGKIKEAGQDLSGGEWQRLAMARAMVSPAPLRILDEPTAALDPISESRLYEEFERISRDKTTLFISHRLGSTKLADAIFVIGEGRVLEQGSHRELMARSGLYARMYESQRSWYQ